MKNYIYICAYNNENNTDDFLINGSRVVKTNGKYTLVFELESDGDGVIDSYHFYDVKSKVSGTAGSPWSFDNGNGFTDVEGEWTEHESLEDFDFDSDEIAEALYSMRLEFIKKYLNEESQKDFLNKAAVPFSKRDILTEDDCSGDLIFEKCQPPSFTI